MGDLDPDALDLARRFSQPGGVHESEREARKGDQRLDGIAGCSWFLRHDRALKTAERVEEARFACVGLPSDHSERPFPEQLSFAGRLQQVVNSVNDLGSRRVDTLRRHRAFILFREVDLIDDE